ncbi:diguanylate cyclase (GGDEF)-like protein [Paenibacillus mucilaginosus]|uniref:putative bifunctional diguanylate cyclase/phosphodiesterase n=1 Tax=Paenibacillus mucilaginosus TaxID=61624 RepID=UPI003D1DF3DF
MSLKVKLSVILIFSFSVLLGMFGIHAELLEGTEDPYHLGRTAQLSAAVLLILAIAAVVAEYLLCPLRQLLQELEELTSGKFGLTIELDQKDEFGRIRAKIKLLSLILQSYAKELIEKQTRLEHAEYHDALTGFYNREAFGGQIVQLIQDSKEAGKELFIVVIDLDRYKHINDMHGFRAGNAIMREITERIQAFSQQGHTYRVGGDEFVILLEQSKDEATSMAEQLLQSLSKPIAYEELDIHVTASIGISHFPEHGERADCLLSSADTALLKAKQMGGNAFCFFDMEMYVKQQRRVMIESGLHTALERGEMSLVYQPLVNLKSGEVTSNEALLRWAHPDLGTVSPAEFIPIAEEAGIIQQIGEWTLREACKQTKRWHNKGLNHLGISVNLSPRQFQQRDLVTMVESILEETGLPAGCLTLEITENIAVHKEECVISKMQKLKSLGVRMAIDDFGTGYSSLSYLGRFPMDVLKIDKSFVQSILQDSKEKEIVKTVIAIAHTLNLSVTAEGVETEDQLRYLRQQGCDIGQGYLMSKPLSAEECEKLMRFVQAGVLK